MHSHIELTSAFLIWCPPHHEQYYRPYEGILTGETMRQLEGLTEGGLMVNNSALNAIAINILRPSQVPVSMVSIDGGFNQARFAFFLEFTIKNIGIFQGEKKEIVTGFTNHACVDHLGNIDPQTTFYINSRQIVHTTPTNVSAMNNAPVSYMKQNQNILPRIPDFLGQKAVSLRPEDVVANHHIIDVYGDSVPIIDKRYDLNCQYLTTSRDTNIPSYYLDRILTGYQTTLQSHGVADNQEDVFRDVTANVRAEGLYGSDFISVMRGAGDPSNQGCFQFWEVQQRWPRRNDFWQKQIPRPDSKPISLRENTEHWQGTGVEVDIAYNLSHALPALMSKLMILQIDIDMTNYTLGGNPDAAITYVQPMFDYAVTPEKIQFFRQRVLIDIIQGIILQKVPSFHIKISAHLLRDNHFQISVSGGPYIPFAAPMFCESYYSPLIGTTNNLGALTGQIKSIVDHFSYYGAFKPQNQFAMPA